MIYIQDSGKLVYDINSSTQSPIDFLKGSIDDILKTPEQSDKELIDLSEFNYIFDDPNKIKKQTENKYEIFINVTASLLESIEGEEFPNSQNICSNNYFIPVPSGVQYDEYLKVFIEHMEKSMIGAASNG